jgi:hypothetical protein
VLYHEEDSAGQVFGEHVSGGCSSRLSQK